MAYHWRYENAGGTELSGPAETFGDQQEAELWLADVWAELLDTGVEQVTLMCGEEVVYGPMGLRELE